MNVRFKNIFGSITIAKFAFFILGICVIVALFIKPFLHYNFQQTGFLAGLNFFKGFSAYPGGIADYLALFISQFFMFNSLGSFLIVAVASVQGFLALDLVRRLAGDVKLRFTIFALIVIFGIMVMCDYRYPYYASIRLFFAFIFTWFFCLIKSKHPKFSAVIWFLLAGLLFYLASGAALFVFTLSTVLIFLITNKQRLWLSFIPVFLAIAGLLPYLGYKFLFQMSLGNLCKITMVRPPAMLTYSPDISLYICYSLLPAIILAVLFFRRFPAKVSDSTVKQKVPAPKSSFFLQLAFFFSIEFVACSLLGYFLILKSVDPLKQNLLTIEYYAEHEQ